jgi:hypothetical protein
LVAAITDIGPNALTPYDPTFMERLRPLAQRVQLSEGKPVAINLKAQSLR